jgi:putative membrane-bound dehydrogenase-like protein
VQGLEKFKMKNSDLKATKKQLWIPKKLVSTLLLAVISFLTSSHQPTHITYTNGAVPPSEALSTFELEPGFQIELLAAEPLVASPVDMEIDENGKLYVVEMPGYPLDKTGTGRIVLLSDENGDGAMDKRTVFAENLTLPNGILRWKKGVIVTDAPEVLYLEDSDGDGKADIREVLLTGFSLSNPHVNVNNPVYGLDNWIHLSHLGHIGTRKYGTEFGDTGSEIRFAGSTEAPILPKNAASNNVRFQPHTRQLEMASSRSQFGHTFDRWGHHLLTHNQKHIYHEVIAARYLQRNPNLIIPNATQSISDHGDATEVYQITTHPDRQLFTPVGVTTSSSGVTAYDGGLFPPPFDKNIVFVAESVSNLVHADLLSSKGASFTATRLAKNREFLASKDAWSRPVNMYVGPDGALYVLDYYRRIIEHPEWMSDEAVEAGGLYDGQDMGRIYRITPKGTGKPEWTKGLSLGISTSKQLTEYLSHSNQWWRINAQRLLVDRNDKTVISDLEDYVHNAKEAVGRLHALWTLEGMNTLSLQTIAQALKDPEPGVRENAIKLAELHLKDYPDLEKQLLTLENDPNAKVRFQLICTLGLLTSNKATAVRQKLLFQDLQDEWVQIAALSANASQTVPLLHEVLKRYHSQQPAHGELVKRLTTMVAAGQDTTIVQQLIKQATLTGAREKEAFILEGLSEGIKRKKGTLYSLGNSQELLVNAALGHSSELVRTGALNVLKADRKIRPELLQTGINRAKTIVTNRKQKLTARALGVSFLALSKDIDQQEAFLKSLIGATEEPQIQLASLGVLNKIPGAGPGEYILSKWGSLTPDIRDAALELFTSDKHRVSLLLDAIETGKVQSSGLGYVRGVRLMNHPVDALRDRARKLLTNEQGKKKAVADYRNVLTLTGDRHKGLNVFVQNCSVCHQVRGQLGVAFGPDLGTVHNWLSEDLLANILDPSLSMAPGFDFQAIDLNDGETVQGTIASETASALRLRIAPGVEKTINRQDIKSIKTLNSSPMPGFAGQIPQQDMADLIAFLKNSRMDDH